MFYDIYNSNSSIKGAKLRELSYGFVFCKVLKIRKVIKISSMEKTKQNMEMLILPVDAK